MKGKFDKSGSNRQSNPNQYEVIASIENIRGDLVLCAAIYFIKMFFKREFVRV